MPFVICPTCPQGIYVNKTDIEAAKTAHNAEHEKRGTRTPDYIVFVSEAEVTPTWANEVYLAVREGKWLPTKTKEG